jgi:2-polyprenyl-6-methoxyphenol hydroxylase-like FAD-dependent oxidoreductase
MPTSLRIAIVGSGTAGPAVATFLARDGHDVHLFERAPQKLPVGAGFLLQPTGLAVLNELGIRDDLMPDIASHLEIVLPHPLGPGATGSTVFRTIRRPFRRAPPPFSPPPVRPPALSTAFTPKAIS